MLTTKLKNDFLSIGMYLKQTKGYFNEVVEKSKFFGASLWWFDYYIRLDIELINKSLKLDFRAIFLSIDFKL